MITVFSFFASVYAFINCIAVLCAGRSNFFYKLAVIVIELVDGISFCFATLYYLTCKGCNTFCYTSGISCGFAIIPSVIGLGFVSFNLLGCRAVASLASIRNIALCITSRLNLSSCYPRVSNLIAVGVICFKFSGVGYKEDVSYISTSCILFRIFETGAQS